MSRPSIHAWIELYTFNSCHRPVGYQELTLNLLTWMDPSAIARSLDQAVVVVTSN